MKVYRGYIVLSKDKIDVTDPCYNAGTWCRSTLPIQPGKYEYKATEKKVCGCEQITQLSITKISSKKTCIGQKVCSIGVDAGLAGFFEEKPNYSKEEWETLGKAILQSGKVWEAHKDTSFRCEGICSFSGNGDGWYDVYEILDEKKIRCGYTILFL